MTTPEVRPGQIWRDPNGARWFAAISTSGDDQGNECDRLHLVSPNGYYATVDEVRRTLGWVLVLDVESSVETQYAIRITDPNACRTRLIEHWIDLDRALEELALCRRESVTRDDSWIAPGAEVAIVERFGQADRVKLTTVERLTRTQIICATGARFRRSDLGRSDLGAWPAHDTDLLPASDKRVRQAIACTKARSAGAQIAKLSRDSSLQAIEDAEKHLKEIAAIVERALAAVERCKANA